MLQITNTSWFIDLLRFAKVAPRWPTCLQKVAEKFILQQEKSLYIVYGIADARTYLQHMRFDAETIAYLQSLDQLPGLSSGLWSYLQDLVPRPEVHTVEDGTEHPGGTEVARLIGSEIELSLLANPFFSYIDFGTRAATYAREVSSKLRIRVMDEASPMLPFPELAIAWAKACEAGGLVLPNSSWPPRTHISLNAFDFSVLIARAPFERFSDEELVKLRQVRPN